uniref:sialin-like n=1 Tax=Ciona intestinalis TaxID=7719 RepID=UPI000EF4A9E7|nr:sialin-like [Ciona intestinalis]|eukprot:XP_018673029.2 sialin-like [Ciona intestinalis]
MANQKTIRLKEEPTPGCYIKARYVVTIMAALGSVNLYLLRNSLNIAIISMVGVSNSSVSGDKQNETESLIPSAVVCPQYQTNSTTNEPVSQYQEGEFDWSLVKQGLLLSCYWYGYTVSTFPGAWLAQQFGIRITLGVASLLSAILTFFVPLAARLSFSLLVALRITMGLLQGVTLPTIMQSIGIWSPPCENTRHFALSFTGVASGNVVAFTFAGLIISYFGWECTFYVAGGIGCLWSIAWFLLIHDTPLKHPRISKQELSYITESLSDAASTDGKKASFKTVPWRKMLTSRPYWSTVVPHLAENWTMAITHSWVPQYIAKVLGFSIENVGILSSLPYGLNVFSLLASGFLSDFILMKTKIRKTLLRKVFTTIGMGGTVLSFLILPSFGCNHTFAIVLLCTSYMFVGCNYAGYRVALVDMAPSYSGILYSISNVMTCFVMLFATQIVGVMLGDGSLPYWKTMFYVTSAISAFGLLVFLWFGTCELQPWAKSQEEKAGSEQELTFLEKTQDI